MRKARILVVDDTPANIDILIEALSSDYTVAAARDGAKALAMARREPHPDLILLDVMMPEIDGYQVCEQLKADPATAGIPVIFITALDAREDEARGLALGAVDYITKPFHTELVKARVANQSELKLHRDHLNELVEERTRELTLTQDVTIFTLANLAETRDPETGSHIRRTQAYVKRLAEELSIQPKYAAALDPHTIELLYKSAPMHDVGKVGVPDAILLKRGRLTEEELVEIRKHPEYGRRAFEEAARRLGKTSFLRYAEEIAYTHHEKWDGSGYPQGLNGEEIPISGRLMAIADVYDALISVRPYKRAFSHEDAVNLILEGRGTHFDPDMVDAFVRIQDDFRAIAIEFADSEKEIAVMSGEG